MNADRARKVACPKCKAGPHQHCTENGERAFGVIHEARKLAAERALKERRSREADFPKCGCGNVLGLERVRAGLKQCRGCVPDLVLERKDALSLLEDRAVQAKTLDDLVGVVVDLIRSQRHAH